MRFLVILSLLAAAGCEAVAPVPERGRNLYLNNCALCHGRSAKGDGAYASELIVPPADLTGLAARNAGVFPTSDVMAKIYGYPGRHQQSVMPEFGPVLTSRTVMWTDENGVVLETPEALIDLVEYLRSVQRP